MLTGASRPKTGRLTGLRPTCFARMWSVRDPVSRRVRFEDFPSEGKARIAVCPACRSANDVPVSERTRRVRYLMISETGSRESIT